MPAYIYVAQHNTDHHIRVAHGAIWAESRLVAEIFLLERYETEYGTGPDHLEVTPIKEEVIRQAMRELES